MLSERGVRRIDSCFGLAVTMAIVSMAIKLLDYFRCKGKTLMMLSAKLLESVTLISESLRSKSR